MKKIFTSFFLCFIILKIDAQILNKSITSSSCNNLNFEDSTYAGWNTFKGINNNSVLPPVSVNPSFPSTSGSTTVNTTHALINTNNPVDVSTGVSIVSPYNGNNLVRINHIGTGAEVGILERTMIINASQPYINFSYFVVVDASGNHSMVDQPYFGFNILDSVNNIIPSHSLLIVAGTNTLNPGFVQSGSFFYKPWSPVSINLSAYIGQTVTLQFIAADCTQSGHGGHAYVDLDCNTAAPVVANVWPGDANYDLKVDFLDLFYVGAGFNQSGTPRSAQGNSWVATPSTDWSTQSLYLLNSKHADCNGNGLIDSADVLTINQNYGLTHPFKTVLQAQNTQLNSSVKLVKEIPNKDTVYSNETFKLDFNIGEASNMVDSIYAIGFTVEYPNTLLDSSSTKLNYSGSVIGNNLLHLSKIRSNEIDVAVSGINQANATNISGKAFSLNLKTKLHVIDTTVQFNITNIQAITKSGNYLQFAPLSKDIKFLRENIATGINTHFLSEDVLVFPNPCIDQLEISSSNATSINAYSISSVLGEEIMRESVLQKDNFMINVSQLSKGLYFVKLFSASGQTVEKRFVKH